MLPSSPEVLVTTRKVSVDATLTPGSVVLPSLSQSRVRRVTKTANQRIEEILVSAEESKKKSAHFWDDPKRIAKAQRLAKLYNGNIDDGIIKSSVQRRHLLDSSNDVNVNNMSGRVSPSLRGGFKKSHLTSAREKLKIAAQNFNDSASNALKRFEEKELFPEDLQDLLYRVFLLKFTIAECVAIVAEFDKDNSGSVNYAEFLTSFLRLAFNNKTEMTLEQDYTSQMAREKMERDQVLMEQKFASSQAVKIRSDYTAADLHLALDRVAICSSMYDRARGPAMHSFDSRLMDHTGFKQQLFRMFNIHLTSKELAALFEYFDKDSSGLIDMTEFLISFFQLSSRAPAARERLKNMQESGGLFVAPKKATEDEGDRASTLAMDKIRLMASKNDNFNLKEAFDYFDKDNSGSISHEELKDIVSQICGGGASGDMDSAMVESLIRHFDPNRDGDIRYDEFAYSFYNRRSAKTQSEKSLASIELNVDRVLASITARKECSDSVFDSKTVSSVAETTKAANKPIRITTGMIKTALRVMDKVRQRTARMSLKEAFEHFDADHSGSISHSELTTAIREVSGERLKPEENAAVIAM